MNILQVKKKRKKINKIVTCNMEISSTTFSKYLTAVFLSEIGVEKG